MIKRIMVTQRDIDHQECPLTAAINRKLKAGYSAGIGVTGIMIFLDEVEVGLPIPLPPEAHRFWHEDMRGMGTKLLPIRFDLDLPKSILLGVHGNAKDGSDE